MQKIKIVHLVKPFNSPSSIRKCNTLGSKIVTLSGYKGYKQLSLKERDRITEMKSEGMRQSQKLWVCSYFARPYASWQRGYNEQVNGMVRRYFPKGTDFSKITDEQVAWVESRINNRPRKCLGYKTPAKVAAVALAL